MDKNDDISYKCGEFNRIRIPNGNIGLIKRLNAAVSLNNYRNCKDLLNKYRRIQSDVVI